MAGQGGAPQAGPCPSKALNFLEEEIDLDRIDGRDNAYRISTDDVAEETVASIESLGLINPPILLPRSDTHTVVCGFKRIAACRRLGMQHLPARLAPSSTPPSALAALAIADNALQRPLNLMEQARAYGLILAVADSEEERMHLAAQTGLAANAAIMKKSARLLALPDFIQAGIISETISLAMAFDLGALDPGAARILVGLFEQLKLGLNKQREVLTLAVEICRREGFSLEALFQGGPLQSILANPDWDRNRKTHMLRTYLRQRRFPEISRAENEFAHLCKGLKLGPGIKLSAPKHFEGLVYTLSLSFQNEAELAGHHTTLERILADPRLAKILSRE